MGFTLNLVVAGPMSLADVPLLEAKNHGILLSVNPFPMPNATLSTDTSCFEMDALLSQLTQTKQLCVLVKTEFAFPTELYLVSFFPFLFGFLGNIQSCKTPRGC